MHAPSRDLDLQSMGDRALGINSASSMKMLNVGNEGEKKTICSIFLYVYLIHIHKSIKSVVPPAPLARVSIGQSRIQPLSKS
jgi:hypothetical protein